MERGENKLGFVMNTSNNGRLDIPFKDLGSPLFVLGANGVGKSILMHHIYMQNNSQARRILAHRQTWFSSNTAGLTAHQKRENEKYIKNADMRSNSRWKDEHANSRPEISIYNLVDTVNTRARTITSAVDDNDFALVQKLRTTKSSLSILNELLEISNVNIKIQLEAGDKLFVFKGDSDPYSIAELSDCEKNSLLMCVDVLTAESNNLIIIDEPERHLHRAIISPLLTSLFQTRSDCTFVISTHDVQLPIDQPDSSLLLVRSCKWNAAEIESWDADLIPKFTEIPDSVKKQILGSKRTILFVEGDYKSLDRQIYQLIYSNISIQPQSNCAQVERTVDGIRNTADLHWVRAFGLIDADDRTPGQLENLLRKGVAALPCYSVESLYYNVEIVRRVASRYAETTGQSADELFEKAVSSIIPSIMPHKERLCAKLCEKRVRDRIMTSLPKKEDILERGSYTVTFDLKEILEQEEDLFDRLVGDNNRDGLIMRYPVRETNVLSGIVSGLGVSRSIYESIVRQLIISDPDTREYYRRLLGSLTNLMEREDNPKNTLASITPGVSQ